MSFGLSLGLPPTSWAPDSYRYAPGYYEYGQPAWNAWALPPCRRRWDREFGCWCIRHADIEVQR